MKTIIRNNVFETNSSSSHSLSVEQNEFDYYLENLSYLINENGDIWLDCEGDNLQDEIEFNTEIRISGVKEKISFLFTLWNTYVDDIKELANKGVKKILILGEKDFGYNSGKVDLNSRNHKEWRWFLSDLFKLFEVVSFDNLALEQLKPERFLTKKDFDTFNQGEYSMYINAVEGYYSPSSRSNHRMYWNKVSIKEFFSIKDYFDKCYPK